MKRVTREEVFYAFSADLKPVLEIEPGERVLIETHDCFCGQIQTEADTIENLDWNRVNPATGPLYIRGAHPGDILAVEIEDVRVADRGAMVTIPGEGALGDIITETETRFFSMEAGQVVFSDRIHLPVKPMIGVIGVAPQGKPVSNGTPGPHGGNIDCTLIGAGCTVYLPVNAEGALLGIGDLHSLMGDGEIVVCGLEVAGEVVIRTRVLKTAKLPTPFLETADLVATVYSAQTIDEAASGAIHHMAQFLTDAVGVGVNEAGMIMSIAGELKFCQVVDPMKTVRFEFPKSIVEAYGFKIGELR
ncbi:MAG: acetamidase/formamidase family protein [Chloroflexi bacterium]|nr:acetamidase/formamidase family protein [Chloroflexota bacterium]